MSFGGSTTTKSADRFVEGWGSGDVIASTASPTSEREAAIWKRAGEDGMREMWAAAHPTSEGGISQGAVHHGTAKNSNEAQRERHDDDNEGSPASSFGGTMGARADSYHQQRASVDVYSSTASVGLHPVIPNSRRAARRMKSNGVFNQVTSLSTAASPQMPDLTTGTTSPINLMGAAASNSINNNTAAQAYGPEGTPLISFATHTVPRKPLVRNAASSRKPQGAGVSSVRSNVPPTSRGEHVDSLNGFRYPMSSAGPNQHAIHPSGLVHPGDDPLMANTFGRREDSEELSPRGNSPVLVRYRSFDSSQDFADSATEYPAGARTMGNGGGRVPPTQMQQRQPHPPSAITASSDSPPLVPIFRIQQSRMRAYLGETPFSTLHAQPVLVVGLAATSFIMACTYILQHHLLDTKDHIGLFFMGSYMAFSSYFMVHFFLEKYSTSFRKISQDKKFYTISNILKASMLAAITPFALKNLYLIILYDSWDTNTLRNLGCVYAIPDFVSLLIVKRMAWTTVFHHVCVFMFNVFSIHNDYNEQNVCRLIVVYAAFSTFAYVVNMLLASRFLGVSGRVSKVLAFLALSVYVLCCAINWTWQAHYLRRLIKENDHWTIYLYMMLICFVMWDDIVLNRWLFRNFRNTAASGHGAPTVITNTSNTHVYANSGRAATTTAPHRAPTSVSDYRGPSRQEPEQPSIAPSPLVASEASTSDNGALARAGGEGRASSTTAARTGLGGVLAPQGWFGTGWPVLHVSRHQ